MSRTARARSPARTEGRGAGPWATALLASALGVALPVLAAAQEAARGAQHPAAPPPLPPRISVQVRGPVALVEIDRPVRLGREYGARSADEVVLDLALPAGARLARAELRGPGTGTPALRLRPSAAPAASAAYLQALQARQWRRAKVAPQGDEGADLRLAVASAGLSSGSDPEALRLRARFVAPLVCRGGDLVLSFPAALDPTAPATSVEVDVDLGAAGPALARVEVAGVRFANPRGALRTTVATGSPWQIVVAPAHPRAAAAARAAVVFAASAGGAVVANLCRGPAPPAAQATPPPGRVLFLIDRSRSMGPTGASSAGALARALALALPPGAHFAAVLFDREAEPLFPVFRAPTLEALAALESAIEAGSLRNGTRLVTALHRGDQLLAQKSAEPGAGKSAAQDALVVVITDGALPEDQSRAAIGQALQGPGLGHARMAVLILRAATEEVPAPAALRALAALPGLRGGLLRQIDPVGAAGLAPELIAALAAGGDLIDLRATGALGAGRFDRTAVAPAQGALWVGRAPGTSPGGEVVLHASQAGRAISWGAAMVAIDPGWATALAALAAPPASLPAFAAVPSEGERLALVTPAALDEAAVGAQRGQLDRDVVHRALAYAYLPRARACYLTRAVKTAADFQLRGRLRLELHLERGEMMEAVVARSSLGRAEIETCLREAAYLVDVPRPVLADAPAIAALNLVFRPRTEAASRDTAPVGELDRSIDRLLGPRGPASDPLELLIEDDARPPPGGGAGAGPAAGKLP